MKKPGIRLLVVDDHFFVRMGLTGSLNAEPDIRVVAEADNGTQALKMFREHKPDVVIMDGGAADDLVKSGLARADGKQQLARSEIGMSVREGAPKPDMSTVESFKAMLLAAKSIAYSDSGSGTFLSGTLFPKLGIADQIANKVRKVRGPPSGEAVAAVVARGEAELGFQQVAELINVPGTTYVGTLPPSLQPEIFFSAAVTRDAREPDAAKALIAYLASPKNAAVFIKAGLAPISAK